MNFEVRVGFVILEADVEGRLMLLDQRVFQNQGFQFAVGQPPGDVLNFGDQMLALGAPSLTGREVTAHSATQNGGLADIEDFSLPCL